jgi:Domain of unknown function (DUF3859)
MKSVLLAVLGAGLLLAGSADGQQARIERVVIVEAGLLEARKVDQVATPGTASGTTSVLDTVVFYESSRQVPARIGVQFGVRYRIIGAPDGQEATIRVKWLVPEPGMRNPVTGVATREDEAAETVVVGTDRLAGYRFGQPWEIVPGKWTLELWSGNRQLAGVTFTVGNE